MNDYELDHLEGLKLFQKEHSRFLRVCRGAGAHPMEVQELLTQYHKFSQMVKKMGGMKGLFRDGPDQNINPQQMEQLNYEMAKMMDPKVLNQMGGMDGLKKMMEQFQDVSSGKSKKKEFPTGMF